MTLTEFLTARLDEDEAQAFELIARQRRKLTVRDVSLGYVRAFDPKRVADDVAAKRAIVAGWSDPMGQLDAAQANAARAEKMRVLRLLAQTYADHPDFDPAWRV